MMPDEDEELVTCYLCRCVKTVDMIVEHLLTQHGVTVENIASAPHTTEKEEPNA